MIAFVLLMIIVSSLIMIVSVKINYYLPDPTERKLEDKDDFDVVEDENSLKV